MTAPAKCFQDLIVWKKAHTLVLDIYRLSAHFPKEEIYGLTAQLRRSVISVPANIAEGFKKKSPADKIRFLNIAQGSLGETKYYLILTKDLNYADTTALMTSVEEISKLLTSYIKAIARNR